MATLKELDMAMLESISSFVKREDFPWLTDEDWESRNKKPEVKEVKCTCGKDKHGFTSHMDFCPKYDKDNDGNGKL